MGFVWAEEAGGTGDAFCGFECLAGETIGAEGVCEGLDGGLGTGFAAEGAFWLEGGGTDADEGAEGFGGGAFALAGFGVED